MPLKDPVARKAYAKAFQKKWMLAKKNERNALGICRVSGCGEPHCEKSMNYCDKHREMNRLNRLEQLKRERAKAGRIELEVGQRVHIDADNKEWGRVCCDAIVTKTFNNQFVQVNAESIRAIINVRKYEATNIS